MSDLSEKEKRAYNILKLALKEEKKPEEKINEKIEVIKSIIPLEDDSWKKIKMAYKTNIGITNPSAEFLIKPESQNDWVDSKKVERKYFERYLEYLRDEDFPEESIEKIVKSTEEILNHCADPDNMNDITNAKKKGLVMGDVQSGKTANYIALINLAADYGYKVIVLLAGMTNSLRVQTQDRIDAGFIGAKSSTIGSAKIDYIGIGTIDDLKYYAIPMTNDSNDFRKDVRKNLNMNVGDINKPQILVVKKNKSVLTQVKDYLKPGQNNITSNNILIIDDESDNASVNTKSEEDPSIINSLIRDLFNNFSIATYVGYTATPFANIFINPYDEEINKDLFPSDFIVQLHSPSNYFGASVVFEPDENNKYKYLRVLDPHEPNFLLHTHKKADEIFDEIPTSLKEAVNDFILVNVIRTLRGKEFAHRTMMVNISRFNDIQIKIEEKINEYVDLMKMTIEQTYNLKFEQFIKDDNMRKLYDQYMKDDFYSEIRKEYSWDQIQRNLNREIKQFIVTTINNDNKKNRFNYSEYSESGARVIAIGGYILSRGLTLNGLMISYYNRKANAYDTVLQMCRWFGYRNDYQDLCRIYLTQEEIDNFGDVIDAVDDLKDQFTQMKLKGKSPDDFGLMIKQSPKRLNTQMTIALAKDRYLRMTITSKNKMRNTEDRVLQLDYSGTIADTSKLFLSTKINNENFKSFYNFVEILKEKELYFKEIKNNNHRNRWMIKRAPKTIIADFISNLKFPPSNKTFDVELVSDFIRKSSEMPEWDVVIATGDKNVKLMENEKGYWEFNKVDFPLVTRSFEIDEDRKEIIRISGNRNRLVDPGIFVSGLDEEQEKQSDEVQRERLKNSPGKKGKTKIASDYLNISRRPLLVIHPIRLNDKENKNLYEEEAIKEFNFGNNPLLGIALGFPKSDSGETVEYVLNRVKIDELAQDFENEEGYDPNED